MGFNDQVIALADASATASRKSYDESLLRLKPAGSGNGTHSALLAISNLGVRAGLPAEAIFMDIRVNLPRGERNVSDREIQQAIDKALIDGGKPPASAVMAGPPRIRPELRDAIIKQGASASVEDILAASPVAIPADPVDQQRVLLAELYQAHECVFIGERHGAQVRPVSDWIAEVDRCGSLGPHIIPNPLTGQEGLTKGGKPSCRADACVASFRFAVVEYDNMSLDQQIAFWAGIRLPVAAIIHSGGKSLHGWVRVDAADRVAWERDIEAGLFGERLVPMGVDASCRNEARLSRMPGFLRHDSQTLQKLLYLAPQGKAVRS